MKARGVVFAGMVLLTMGAVQSCFAQARVAPIEEQACGAYKAEVKSRPVSADTLINTPPSGKALIYLIEQMPSPGMATTHVRFGVEGNWVAQLETASYTSVVLDPGVHHLCAVYQGNLVGSEMGKLMLHRVNAEAGKTYYLLYRGIIIQDGGQMAFFDLVDEDEGRYLLQYLQAMVTTTKKK